MYTPKEGKNLLTKKGVINAGSEIKPEYISGGQKAFDELVEKGIIVKSKESIAEIIVDDEKAKAKAEADADEKVKAAADANKINFGARRN